MGHTWPVRTIGNILWFLLSGLWLALGFVVTGALLCVTIIGIPFGVQAFKLAGFALWPFGKVVVRAPGDDGGVLELVANVLWLIVFGWGLFLSAVAAGLLLTITIIGFPFAIQSFKIGVLALWPFGRTVLAADEAAAVAGARSL